MPMVTVATNLADSDVPIEFNEKLTQILSESMNKPVDKITVQLQTGQRITRGGTFLPNILISIRSIGMVTGEDNIRHTEKVTNLVTEMLRINPERIALEYFNLTPETVGINGTTVANASKM